MKSECKVECCSIVNRSFCPHLSTVPIYYSLNRCQTNSCTGKLLRRMQPLKWPKKLSGISHVESGSVVLYLINDMPVVARRSELNLLRLPFGSKLPCV